MNLHLIVYSNVPFSTQTFPFSGIHIVKLKKKKSFGSVSYVNQYIQNHITSTCNQSLNKEHISLS